MRSFDWWLLVPTAILISTGLLMLRSVAPDQLIYQAAFIAVSIVVFLIFAQTDYQLFFSLHLPIYAISCLSLLVPFALGITSRGAHRWIQFGQVFVQPSEITKPFFLITFAVLAASNIRNKQFWLIASFIFPAIVIFLQPDLGSMLVLGIGWLTIFVPQLPRKFLLLALVITLLLSPVIWSVLRPYQKDRLTTFIDPYSDPLDRGYQVIQSTLAVGSGQFWGRGLGQGPQSQLQFLPERHTDFMFAALAEELGFVGAITVLAMFGWLLARIYFTSQKASDLSANFFCLGVLAMISFQVFINVGMNMGIAPVTGITLPLVSYGGSSLFSVATTLGLIVSISRHSRTLKIGSSQV